jgi:hypothetical protein
MKESTRVRLMVTFGAVLLIVPAAILLTMADAAFRDQCKIKCTGQAYRVTTVGHGPNLQYPADCHCIAPADRTFWEKLRDLVM